jgi:hypothetical protein
VADAGHFLIAGFFAAANPQGVGARDVDHTGADGAGGVGDIAGPGHVDRAMHAERRPADVDVAGRVNDAGDALASPASGLEMAGVAVDDFDIEVEKGPGIAPIADEHADRLAAGQEQPHDVIADQARGAGDECQHLDSLWVKYGARAARRGTDSAMMSHRDGDPLPCSPGGIRSRATPASM